MGFIHLRPFGNFVTVINMKFLMTVHDTRLKNKTSKVKLKGLDKVSGVFTAFLSKNPHFKSVRFVSLNLTFCGKTKIKRLNGQYRSINKITDVLSFGVHENVRLDNKKKQMLPYEVELGDIFICNEVASKQAQEFGISYDQEVFHLLTHGLLHLLGYDHEISLKEEKLMESMEAEIIKAVYAKLGNK
jgi:probable rRNA maturation factor